MNQHRPSAFGPAESDFLSKEELALLSQIKAREERVRILSPSDAARNLAVFAYGTQTQ